MNTTPETLARAGRLLHGSQWQRGLAADLAIAERTMARWVHGQYPIPAGIAAELAQLLRQRAADALALADSLAPSDATAAGPGADPAARPTTPGR